MSHTVEIDDAALDEAFDRYAAGGRPGAAGGGADLLPAGQPGPDTQARDGWMGPAGVVADLLRYKVCPNWGVPDKVRDDWAEAAAGVLADLFPGGIANIDEWGPWSKLAMATGTWALCGWDWERMRLKPLHPATVDGEATTETGEPAQEYTAPPGAFRTEGD